LICVQHRFQQYFNYIMVTSFSGGRSRSTRREPPTMGKQLVSIITSDCELSAPFYVICKVGREPTVVYLDLILFDGYCSVALFIGYINKEKYYLFVKTCVLLNKLWSIKSWVISSTLVHIYIKIPLKIFSSCLFTY
jgi:hypothetical protein